MEVLIPAQAEVVICTDDYAILFAFGDVLERLFPILHQTPRLLDTNGKCMCKEIAEAQWPEILQLEQSCLEVFKYTLTHDGPDNQPFEPDESACWLSESERRRMWLVRWLSEPGLFDDNVSVLSDITNLSGGAPDDVSYTANSGYIADSDDTTYSTLSFALSL